MCNHLNLEMAELLFKQGKMVNKLIDNNQAFYHDNYMQWDVIGGINRLISQGMSLFIARC